MSLEKTIQHLHTEEFHIGSRSGFNCNHIQIYDGEDTHHDTTILTVSGIHQQCDDDEVQTTQGYPIAKRVCDMQQAFLGVKDPLAHMQAMQKDRETLQAIYKILKYTDYRRGLEYDKTHHINKMLEEVLFP